MRIGILRQFQHLAIARSPENLSCDGELSRRQVQSRHAAIMREWRLLEKQVGRKVTLEEVQRLVARDDEYPPYYMMGRGAA